MPIQALPVTTRRLLSSSQILATPASLVKELIDNALDAKATSIDVLITTNTVDRIEVRDNGYGIAPEDLYAVGKPGYTSKLRTFEELKTLGGLTLGFRGEALASAIELGDLSITTRTEGEAVAASIKLNTRGGIESQTVMSHPVGTTVCVTNFLSKLPVRKQNALKDAKKTISRIKEILQSYAMARLNVRLTLKVLKAGRGNWLFAPRPNDGIKELVAQLVGRDIAAQCVEKTETFPTPSQIGVESSSLSGNSSAFPNNHERPEAQLRSEFVIRAFLPRPDADLTRINGGQYVSIDSRPVSPTRGSSKKIISMYKAIILAISVDGTSEKATNPFIRLNIMCPAGSYDPNIEPAKDNVVFEDEPLLLSLVKGWLESVYGDRLASTTALNKSSISQDKVGDRVQPIRRIESMTVDSIACPSTSSRSESLESSYLNDGDANTVREPRLVSKVADQPALPVNSQTPGIIPNRSQPNSVFDMSRDFAGHLELNENEQTAACNALSAEQPRKKQIPRNSLNPWVIAKLNAPTVMEKNTRVWSTPDPLGKKTSKPPPTPPMLPTPYESLISHLSPKNCPLLHTERSLLDDTLASENTQSSPETWFKRHRAVFCDSSASQNPMQLPSPEGSDRVRSSAQIRNIVTATDVMCDIQRSSPTSQGHLVSSRTRRCNRPFIAMLKDSPPFFVLDPPSLREPKVKGLPSRRPQYEEGTSDMTFDLEAQDLIPPQASSQDVHEALDFERRKEVATGKLREELRHSQASSVIPSNLRRSTTILSPHKNRYHAAVAALELSQGYPLIDSTRDKLPVDTSLPEDDPRAYLMGRQKSLITYFKKYGVERPLKRAKTTLLPLGIIPSSTELHKLSHTVSSNISLVRQALLTLTSYDEYIKSGGQASGLDMPTADVATIEKKLNFIVKVWTQTKRIEQVESS